ATSSARCPTSTRSAASQFRSDQPQAAPSRGRPAGSRADDPRFPPAGPGRPALPPGAAALAEPGEQVVVVHHDHVVADLVLVGRAAEGMTRRRRADTAAPD